MNHTFCEISGRGSGLTLPTSSRLPDASAGPWMRTVGVSNNISSRHVFNLDAWEFRVFMFVFLCFLAHFAFAYVNVVCLILFFCVCEVIQRVGARPTVSAYAPPRPAHILACTFFSFFLKTLGPEAE